MKDLTHLNFGTSAAIGLMGYFVVFLGLALLMLVVLLLNRITRRKAASAGRTSKTDEHGMVAQPTAAERSEQSEPELFDTNPRDAAMVMAIIAHQLGKPLEELRFKSIREIR